MSLTLVFLITALVMFGLAACGVSAGRFNLVAGGLFFWVLSMIVR